MTTLDIEAAFNEAQNGSWDEAIEMVEDLIEQEAAPLRATVERVRALADEWESDPAEGGYADALFAAARDLLAALADPKEDA